MTRDETTDVLRRFDRDGNGFLDYNEFIDFVGFERGGGGGGDGGVIDDVLERLRKRISRDIKHGSDMEKVDD